MERTGALGNISSGQAAKVLRIRKIVPIVGFFRYSLSAIIRLIDFRGSPSLPQQTFTDGDAYASAIRQADVEVTMLRPKQREWRVSHCELGGAHIQQGFSGGGLICNGLSPTRGTILFLPLSNANDHSANGQSLDSASATVLSRNTEFHLAIRAPHEWCSIYLPDDDVLHSDTTPLQMSGHRHTKNMGCRVVRVSTPSANHLHRLVVDLIDVMHRHAHRLAAVEIQQHTVRQIREYAAPFLMHEETFPATNVGRPELSRDEIIQRVMIEVDTRRDSPLSVSDLAIAAEVSERTLRTVFQQYFGLCPARYLKLRQLHSVRHRLQQSDSRDGRSVGSVLSSFGIWQFGRFAAEYRRLFGELPSETLYRCGK
jgi:AraC family ethanolamine operon transcriptional activator